MVLRFLFVSFFLGLPGQDGIPGSPGQPGPVGLLEDPNNDGVQGLSFIIVFLGSWLYEFI